MGERYDCKCNSCGYEIHANLGVGFMFPVEYAETVERMKKGELGEEAQQFFKDQPYGAVDCERIMVKCLGCGSFEAVQNLTMYIPKTADTRQKKSSKKGFSYEKDSYIFSDELKKYYKEYKKYEHYCPKCGGRQEVISDFEKQAQSGTLKCPKCSGLMKKEENTLWD